MDFEGRYEPPGGEVEAEEAFELEESQRSRRKRHKRPAPGKVTRTLSMDGLEAFARELRSERSRATSDVPAPPERARVGAVQADGGRVAPLDPFAVHLAAREGVSGGGSELPHLTAIQRAFGHHDVSGVRAHVGGAAADAAAEIGARAYATGDDVAFAATPDLRQAAHEAAHVVQQRGGVRLDGGVGARGDVYEQHADAVADLVVRGDSAEALLDTMAHRGPSGGPAVQRDGEGEGQTGTQPGSRRPQQRTRNQGQFTFEFPDRQLGGPYRLGLVQATPKLAGQVSVTVARREQPGQEARPGDTTTTTTQGTTVDSEGNIAYQRQVQSEINRSILGFRPSLTGDVELGSNGASLSFGGSLQTDDEHAGWARQTIRSVSAQIVLAEWDRSESGSGLRLVGADLTLALGIPPFQMRLGGLEAQIAPELHIKLEIDPDWRAIARRLLQQIAQRAATSAATAGTGAAATDAALAGAGAGLAGPAFAAALGVAAAYVTYRLAVAELGAADEMERVTRQAPISLYRFCISYTGTYFGVGSYSGRDGSSGRSAAQAAMRRVAEQHNLTLEQVRERAREMGGRALYQQIFDHARPAFRDQAADRVGSRVRFGDMINMALDGARWGGSVFNREGGSHGVPTHGHVPEPSARRAEAPAAGGGGGDDAQVQADGGRIAAMGDIDGGLSSDAVRRIAAEGVSGAGGELPYLDTIQRSFGHHDVTGVSAHVGGTATRAAAAMGARAYATGDAVAFGAAPDLHTAAHEAAHVVQQRGGVRLAGGVGQAGDEYERHADDVADAVVRGDSAEALLDAHAHRGAGGGPAVQHLIERSGAAAMQTAREVLAHADRQVLESVIQQLEAQASAEVATVQFADSRELYRIHLPNAQIQTLRDECVGWWRRAPAGPPVWNPNANVGPQPAPNGGAAPGAAEPPTGGAAPADTAAPRAPASHGEVELRPATGRDATTGAAMIEHTTNTAALQSAYDELHGEVPTEFGADWAAYTANFMTIPFLRGSVTGHRVFLERLARAEAWLTEQGHLEEIRSRVTPNRSASQMREFDTAARLSYHHLGLAVDISAGQNPWIGEGRARGHETRASVAALVTWHAAWLTGHGSAMSAVGASETGYGNRDSGAVWDQFNASSAATVEYFALASDPAALAARIAALGAPPAAPGGFDAVPGGLPSGTTLSTATAWTALAEESRAATAERWAEMIGAQHAAWTRFVGTRDGGFISLERNLVIALRDIGGLAWGACDFGQHSASGGDFMHFDARTIFPYRTFTRFKGLLAAAERSGTADSGGE